MGKHKFEPPPAGAALFAINEVCWMTRLGRNSVYRAIGDGSLKMVKLGRRTFIPAPALRGWMEANGLSLDWFRADQSAAG